MFVQSRRVGRCGAQCAVKIREAWRQSHRRYGATPGGIRYRRERAAREVRTGDGAVRFYAPTLAAAQQVRAYIRRRREAFRVQQRAGAALAQDD